MLIENMGSYTPPDPDLHKKIRCPKCKKIGVVEWNTEFTIKDGTGKLVNMRWTDEGMAWMRRQSGFSIDPEWYCKQCDVRFRLDNIAGHATEDTISDENDQ